VEKRRSGSETRQRTERLNLRLLPSEQRALRVLAEQAGHRSVQAWILEAIGPASSTETIQNGSHVRSDTSVRTTDSFATRLDAVVLDCG
jgi:uncharacterized protein (DUF1778 family)